jgi:hypothetical protein
MDASFKNYVFECFREAPNSWRKGTVAMTVLLNVVLLGFVYAHKRDGRRAVNALISCTAICALKICSRLVLCPYVPLSFSDT